MPRTIKASKKIESKKSPIYSLGIDVGGTKIEAAVICNAAKITVISRVRKPTERIKGREHILKTMVDVAKTALKQAQVSAKDLVGVGFGLPGSVDPKTGKMVFGNTNAIAGVDFKKLIRTALASPKLNVAVENDANCFAYAEAHFGAGKKYGGNGLGIILGTGVGGGIVLEGKVLRGKRGGAGEIGHTELYTNGLSCYCGSLGCAENYLSGPALEAAFFKRSGVQTKARDICERAMIGDPAAKAVIIQYKKDLAKFIGNLNNIFDPEFVVLGGGLSNFKDLVTGLKGEIQSHCFLPDSAPDVLINELGDSAGVIGAALIAALS